MIWSIVNIYRYCTSLSSGQSAFMCFVWARTESDCDCDWRTLDTDYPTCQPKTRDRDDAGGGGLEKNKKTHNTNTRNSRAHHHCRCRFSQPDGMTDCSDSECCSDPICAEHIMCLASNDPVEVLLRKQPPSVTASFYQRVKFLIEENSVQSYAHMDEYSERWVDSVFNLLSHNYYYGAQAFVASWELQQGALEEKRRNR